MEIRFVGKLENNDKEAIYSVITKQIPEKDKSIIPLWQIVIMLGCVLSIVSIYLFINYWNSWISFIVAIIAIILLIGSIKIRNDILNKVDLFVNKFPKMEGTISSEEIVVKTTLAENKYKWEAYSSYGEERNIISLFQENILVLPLKETFFERKEDWEEVKQLIKDKLPKKYGKKDEKANINYLNLIPIILLFLFMIIFLILRK
jgi:hypothetical protein